MCCHFACKQVTYLARKGFNFPILNTGSSFAHVHGVIEESLVFDR